MSTSPRPIISPRPITSPMPGTSWGPIVSRSPSTSSRSNGSNEPGWRPAAASSAIAPLLRGADRAVTVLASFPQAAYLRVGDDLVALVTSDGIRHPNAVAIDLPSTVRPLDRLAIAPVGRIGRHGLSVGGLELRIVRWWDPRPRLRTCTPAGLRAASDVTRRRVASFAEPSWPPGGTALNAPSAGPLAGNVVGSPAHSLADSLAEVVAALRVGDGMAASAAAERMIGLGPGLTPSGDDRLAGLIGGTRVLAAATPAEDLDGRAEAVAAARELGRAVATSAVGRTTSVSAALLGHAALGQLADPATDLVRTWTSAGSSSPARSQDPYPIALDGGVGVVRATDRLLAVGSSSGRDLTLGLLAAVELLTGEHAGPTHAASTHATSPRTHHTTERSS